MASIGDRVKQRRKELGFSQGEISRRVGFSQATLSQLETNGSATTKEIAKLAAILGVDALWLSDGRGEKIPNGTAPVIQNDIPDNVLRLAEKLLLLPSDKLKALSVLVGIKF